MPGYGWLADTPVDGQLVQKKLKALSMLGDPYTEEEIAAAPAAVEGKSEMDAVIAYLQGLGLARSGR
jgi:cytochrome c oxidase cbb3-type subunit 2